MDENRDKRREPVIRAFVALYRETCIGASALLVAGFVFAKFAVGLFDSVFYFMDQVVSKQEKKWYFKWYMWVVYVFVFFVVIGSFGDTPKPVATTNGSAAETVAEVPAIKVASTQIVNDYKDNEVAGDAKYKGKTVEVSGVVDTIGKDVLDTPFISLESYQYAILDHVQCMFSKSDEAELATVSKGQKIVLRGEVNGKMGNILLKGCEIVK